MSSTITLCSPKSTTDSFALQNTATQPSQVFHAHNRHLVSNPTEYPYICETRMAATHRSHTQKPVPNITLEDVQDLADINTRSESGSVATTEDSDSSFISASEVLSD
ncbi:hypothetical protein PHLCEN_2v3502 [Hermanssonia centrifuga]|uniref:Uncharacterized protein n=1 Tax=Hermanssonia centrifuga TaxID=98765 RepID=A0A2R6QEZ4_9APHY|nr:hypothetical protein PHLCEN_2v3502 [Hermanssonia centrifuga]